MQIQRLSHTLLVLWWQVYEFVVSADHAGLLMSGQKLWSSHLHIDKHADTALESHISNAGVAGA